MQKVEAEFQACTSSLLGAGGGWGLQELWDRGLWVWKCPQSLPLLSDNCFWLSCGLGQAWLHQDRPRGCSLSGGWVTGARVCVCILVGIGRYIGLETSVLLKSCLAVAYSHRAKLKLLTHTPTPTNIQELCVDHSLICLYIQMCMYTCVHWHVWTFVYLCVLISINAHGYVFMCAFLFWERVWNISAQIREHCRGHCCVFQNHDYFLSCLRRKSKLTPSPFSLRELCLQTHLCVRVHSAAWHACTSVLPPSV